MATVLSVMVAASLLSAPSGSQIVGSRVGDVEFVEGGGVSGYTIPSPDTEFTHFEIDGKEIDIYALAAPEIFLESVE